jgi:hypothetical protein
MDVHFASLDRLGHRRGALAFACAAFGVLYLVSAVGSAPRIDAAVAAASRLDLSQGVGPIMSLVVPFIALWLVLWHLHGYGAFAGLMLLFPGVALSLATGATGVVTAALLGGALLTLEARPALAGILLGLLGYRPDLAALALLALLCGRHWRAFAAAAATTAALIFAGVAAAGWPAVFAKLSVLVSVPDAEAMLWARLPSVYAAVHLMGGDMLVGRLLQAGVAVATLAIVGAIWLRLAPLAWRGSALALAFVLATPHATAGDLAVLVLPLAWLMQHMAGEESGAGEEFLVALAWFAPAVFWVIALAGGPPIMPVMLAALGFLIWRRAFPPTRLASHDAVKVA